MSDRTTVSFGNAVALWIVAVVAIIFFLRAAQTLLIPIALAVLISYALAPAVSWLERHRARSRVPILNGADSQQPSLTTSMPSFSGTCWCCL